MRRAGPTSVPADGGLAWLCAATRSVLVGRLRTCFDSSRSDGAQRVDERGVDLLKLGVRHSRADIEYVADISATEMIEHLLDPQSSRRGAPDAT